MNYGQPVEPKSNKSKKTEIYWYTVSYKQILIWSVVVALVGTLGGFALFKHYVVGIYTGGSESGVAAEATAAKRNGHFASIVGTVKVKKFDSVQWLNADTQTVLDEGGLHSNLVRDPSRASSSQTDHNIE
jgi:hypothetical protein